MTAGEILNRESRQGWRRHYWLLSFCRYSAVLLALGALLPAPNAAETLRVTTWNLRAGTAIPEEKFTTEAAGVLRKLDPDVILLQGVDAREECERITRALAPARYEISICSSFVPLTTASNQAQVAILSKQAPLLSWAESWQTPAEMHIPGGYAFTALRLGEHRVGFFAAEMTERQMPALTAQQILDQLQRVRRWETNQVETFALGCSFGSASKAAASVQERLFHFLGLGGFVDALAGIPDEQRATFSNGAGQASGVADFILVDGSAYSAKTEIVPSTIFEHYPVTCTLELDPRMSAKNEAGQLARAQMESARALTHKIGTSPPAPGVPRTTWFRAQDRNWWLFLFPGLVLIVPTLIYLAKRRPRAVVPRPRTYGIPVKLKSEQKLAAARATVIVTPRSTTASGVEMKASPLPQPVIQIESPNVTGTETAERLKRVLAQQQHAEQATRLLRESLAAQLTLWLKQKLVRKLLVDRAELLQAQEQATRKALNVDARLTRLEQQIQRQNQAYERRIEELNRQLLAAKEESRELIRARILQVKAEMETARMKLLAKADEEE